MTPKNTAWNYHRSDFATNRFLERQSLKEKAWPNAFTAVLGALLIWSVVFAVIAYIAWYR
jgi:hypothetical protein